MKYTVYVIGSRRGRTYQQGTDANKVEKLIIQQLKELMSESAARQQVYYSIYHDERAVASGEIKWFNLAGPDVIGHGAWFRDSVPKEHARNVYLLTCKEVV